MTARRHQTVPDEIRLTRRNFNLYANAHRMYVALNRLATTADVMGRTGIAIPEPLKECVRAANSVLRDVDGEP